MCRFLKKVFGSQDEVKLSDTFVQPQGKSFFEDENGETLSMDQAMDQDGFEKIRLRGAGMDNYAPKGAFMAHLNLTIFTKEPVKTSWTNGTIHGSLRRVYRRTEETEDGHIVFVYDPSEDR